MCIFLKLKLSHRELSNKYTVTMLLRRILVGANNFILKENVRMHNTATGKHWDPRWKKERREKVIKVHIPDFHKLKKDMNLPPDEMRTKLKEKGVAPPRPWSERTIQITATGDIFEPYVPPEGDGKLSIISFTGAKQRYERLEKKGKSMLAVRKIRQFDEDFNLKSFAPIAQEIYISAHKAMMEKDEDKLHELVSERCYPEMMNGITNKTMKWQFIESIEPPIAVHVRQTNLITDENIYAQITVRLHTKQTLALYDRFGRLMYGSEIVAKDVLEYLVFEKHLSNLYGQWRIHGKITPDWCVREDNFPKTFVKGVV